MLPTPHRHCKVYKPCLSVHIVHLDSMTETVGCWHAHSVGWSQLKSLVILVGTADQPLFCHLFSAWVNHFMTLAIHTEWLVFLVTLRMFGVVLVSDCFSTPVTSFSSVVSENGFQRAIVIDYPWTEGIVAVRDLTGCSHNLKPRRLPVLCFVS